MAPTPLEQAHKDAMKDKIIAAINQYADEPQDNARFYEIRAIPSPEVLADWIIEAIKN